MTRCQHDELLGAVTEDRIFLHDDPVRLQLGERREGRVASISASFLAFRTQRDTPSRRPLPACSASWAHSAGRSGSPATQ